MALGDDWELSIDVDVTNYGEDAYESSFTAVLPEGAAFARLQRISKVNPVVFNNELKFSVIKPAFCLDFCQRISENIPG